MAAAQKVVPVTFVEKAVASHVAKASAQVQMGDGTVSLNAVEEM